MKNSLLFLLLLFVSCQSLSDKKTLPTNEAVMLQVGNKSVSLNDLKSQFSENKVSVEEPHMKDAVELVGFDLIQLLDSLIPEWKKADGILVTALDGYKSDVSVAKILKYKATLAYRFSKQTEFKIDNNLQNEKDIELGPYYLVWDNINNPGLKREGAYGWPYQVAKLESIQYASHYAKSFPMKNANAKVKAGFEYFKNYCMTCHSVSGETNGGLKGPNLWPYPKLFKGGIKHFSVWVTDPQKIKPGTSMAPLNTKLTQDEKNDVIDKIYAYLVALHKR